MRAERYTISARWTRPIGGMSQASLEWSRALPKRRPIDRKAPLITKEQIEEAQRGEGHKHQRRQIR